jgi:hypothetical protein
MKKSLIVVALALCFAFQAEADLLLQPNDRVAICGSGEYSIYLEDYLIGSKFVPGLDVASYPPPSFKPNVVITDSSGDVNTYEKSQIDLVESLKKSGVRTIVIGSSPAVGPADFQNDAAKAAAENKVRATLAGMAKNIATKEGIAYADVFGETMAAILKATALHGDHYAAQTGWDDAFSLAITSAYLKALGYDGNFGTLTVDFAAGTAEADRGQKLISYKDHTLMVESTHIPLWFPGHGVGGTDPQPWPILKCLTFDQDLNRYMLVVKNLPTAETKVYWGDDNHDFSSDELSRGVNLADVMPGWGNPFAAGIDGNVRSQREIERINNSPSDTQAAAKRDAARQVVRSNVAPVQSKISIVPLAPVAKQPPGPIPVILDTDLDGDVDDVGALALLDNFMDQGEANLLAVVHNTVNGNKSSCGTIKAVNDWYFRPNIPIGQYLGEHPTAPMTSKVDPAPPGPGAYHDPPVGSGSSYTQQVRQRFEPNFPDDDKMPAGVDVYRKALASAPDGQVVICSVGFLENIQDLMLSEPDSISPLSGMDLIKKKVRLMTVMANTNPTDLYVLTHWPTPILWTCDVGNGIGTGPSLIPTPDNNPVRMCYDLFGVLHSGRQSWDLTAAWIAVRGPDIFDVISGRPQYISDTIHDPARDHPNESVVTVKLPLDEDVKIIGTELARPPKQ